MTVAAMLGLPESEHPVLSSLARAFFASGSLPAPYRQDMANAVTS